ncbi:MAG: CAP domain-containing protein [Deltaproteobacteria bacterium]|nr:CAP domain-containing protein [Deltaproteobacteria bacterium]
MSMVRDNDDFDHTGLSGTSPWDRACAACHEQGREVDSAQMSENIAAGNGAASATFEQWRTSSVHNHNMLDETSTVIGMGRAIGGGTYRSDWTTVLSSDDEPVVLVSARVFG